MQRFGFHLTASLLAAAVLSFPRPDDAQGVTQFGVCGSTYGACTLFLTVGGDGNLWFTSWSEFPRLGQIGRITMSGEVTYFPIPSSSSQLNGIAPGPDGNLWFTEYDANAIGKITLQGDVTEFPLPAPQGHPGAIVAGPDGNLWFQDDISPTQAGLGRISTAGDVTAFPIPSVDIAAGPDGNVWVTDREGNRIGRVTPTGAATWFPLPVPVSGPSMITSGPDGNLWFTESANRIGRITPAGTITEFPVTLAGSYQPGSIAPGQDGNVWFIEENINGDFEIGHLTTAGAFLPFVVYPEFCCQFGYNLLFGPDGNIWFTSTYTTFQFGGSGYVDRLILPRAGPLSTIPALDWRGFAALAALLAGVGFFTMRR